MRDFMQEIPLKGDRLESAVKHAAEQTRSCLEEFSGYFKYSHSTNLFYPKSENVEWTTGFWTGELWLMYELTGEAAFRRKALEHVPSFLLRILDRVDVNHHDMGFLYSPSCVAAYKLEGSEEGKRAALLAADNLVSRFQEKGQFIQAWGELGARDNYRLIIDCLLNVPLLFWATEVSGNGYYAEIGTRHIETSMKYILRQNDSTYHTYFFDPETGRPLRGITRQGYRDESVWARGEAWGIYGSILAFRYLHNEEYLDIFWRLLNFFLDHLPEDSIPYWDFDEELPRDEPRDTSAAAIAVCGMLEGARVLGEDDSRKLRDWAERLMGVLYRSAAVKDPSLSNGQLLHGTYARKSPFNPCNDRGVDECCLWGDYFYVEALRRLSGDWNPYW